MERHQQKKKDIAQIDKLARENCKEHHAIVLPHFTQGL